MGPLNEVLYDHLGREYPRKNQYLAEVARIENALKRKEGNAAELQAQLKELQTKKNDHPYLKDLAAFRAKEAEFKKSLADIKGEGFSEDSLNQKLARDLKRAEQRLAFYEPYQDLDYEAKYEYEKAKIETYHLPRIMAFRDKTRQEIKEGKVEQGKISPQEVQAGAAKVQAEKQRLEKEYQAGVEKLKRSQAEGHISKKALKNGIVELKKEKQSKVDVALFNDPAYAVKELISTKEYDLKNQSKVLVDVKEKDIADLRRKTPVEEKPGFAWKSLLTLPFPGLGQILNGQWIKGLLFLLGSLFIYGAAVPYALGYGNYVGQGIFGLFNLAKDAGRRARSIMFMIEGIIALVLLGIALAIIIGSFLDAWKTEKARLKGVRPRSWYETKSGLQTEGFPYLVSLPALLALLFIVIVPLSTTILLSFTNQSPNHQAKFSWIGFDNYVAVLSGKGNVGQAFLRILGWTLTWTLVATTLAIVVGFALALLTNNPRIKGKTIFRTIYLLPWAVPAFITIMFFSLMVAPNGAITGVVNSVIKFFGGKGELLIKNNALATRTALILLQTWLGSAYVFLLSTGVLQAIPEDLYEAAQIDGASNWQKLSRITLPLVLFQTAPLLVGQYTFNFNNFSVIKLFNGGGPFDPAKYGNLGGSSDLLITYIYNLIMDRNYQAMGAAISMMVALGLMIFTFIGFRNSKAFREERL